MTTLADQFQSTNGAPIRYDGRELHAKLALQVKNGDTIELRFLRVGCSISEMEGSHWNCQRIRRGRIRHARSPLAWLKVLKVR